jgi:hypothetical protein
MTTDEHANEHRIEIPIEIAIKQMVPPTWTVREDDRNEMFIRRHIDIPPESRCCKGHTVDDHLTREAFSSLRPYKVENRLFSRQNLMSILQSYRERVNSKKHLDFNDYLCMTDADYTKLTGFTRAQHTRILSYIPSTALKNSITRSARSALGCLLMKLKLGLSNSVLASMVGVSDKRQMSHIISSARVALAQHFVPYHLGLDHLTQQDVIDSHTSPIASRLLTEGRDPCILVLDGTYLFIQVIYAINCFFN